MILAREKIPGKLENRSSSYRSRSFYFRDRSLNGDYAHVSAYSLASARQVTNCQNRVTLVRHSDFVIPSDKLPILNGTNRGEWMVVDQRKDAIVALYKGGAAFDPIAAVVISDLA